MTNKFFDLVRNLILILPVVLLVSCQSAVRFASKSIETKESFIAKGIHTSRDQQLISAAEKWLGTPYQYAGDSHDGIDCSALTCAVFTEIGVNLPRSSEEQYQIGVSAKNQDLRVGDLLFFNTLGKGVSHVGIYVGENRFLHASTTLGVVVESLDNAYYVKKFVGVRRILDDNK